MKGNNVEARLQVVLFLDQREMFGGHVGGKSCASRTTSLQESVRQLQNLGVQAEVLSPPVKPYAAMSFCWTFVSRCACASSAT